MPSLKYNWQRFWCPRESSMSFDNGFIQNPDSKWGTILNPDVKHIEEFASYPCLILFLLRHSVDENRILSLIARPEPDSDRNGRLTESESGGHTGCNDMTRYDRQG